MSITLPGIDIGSRTLSIDFGSSDFLLLLLIGLIAGLVASRVVGVGGGIILDMIVGVIGAFLGRWLFGLFNVNLGPGLLPELIEAVVGASLLLLIVRAIHGSYRRRST
jgi:uncharacterized membrane protein YeaQ/YmgE (transglycosylase-associated protein family)